MFRHISCRILWQEVQAGQPLEPYSSRLPRMELHSVPHAVFMRVHDCFHKLRFDIGNDFPEVLKQQAHIFTLCMARSRAVCTQNRQPEPARSGNSILSGKKTSGRITVIPVLPRYVTGANVFNLASKNKLSKKSQEHLHGYVRVQQGCSPFQAQCRSMPRAAFSHT